MKSITNLFTFLVLFIASIVFLTLPVNAIVYENLVTDPIGLGYFDDDTFLVSEGSSPSNLYRFMPEGAGSGSTNIINIPDYIEDACIGANSQIYFILTDGRIYMFTGGGGYYDFVTDYNTSFQLLGDMDSQNSDRDIVVDTNGNLYVTGYNTLKMLTYPTFSMSTLATHADEVQGVALHKDGIVYGRGDDYSWGNHFVYIWNGTSTEIYKSADWGISPSVHGSIQGLYCTVDGDIYINRYSHTGEAVVFGGIERLNYSNNYERTVLYDIGTVTIPSDIFIDQSGIIYGSYSAADTIVTYATIGAQGGYGAAFYEGATGSKQLYYDVSTLNSLYTAYHNNSEITLTYAIVIDISASGIVMEFETIDEDYYFVIDLLNPNGIMENQAFITDLTEEGWLYITSTANKHGTMTYTATNAWENGTWTAHLYEYNTKTGLRALLDSCEFEITNTTSATDIIETTPDIDPTLDPVNRIDALLESNAFIGLLIILACMAAFGKIGGVAGLVLGTVAGVSLSMLLGYLPSWMFFLMVLALCVVFVSKLVTGFGGND